MAHHFFALIGRMSNIGRWSLMRSARPENVQEHSHMVAVLAHALAVIRRDVYGGTIDPGEAAVAGLYHDATEILTGDMPTPVKYFNPSIRDAYKAVEEISAQRLLDMLPAELQGSYQGAVRESAQSQALHELVKAADKLSAYIKCLDELKAGNHEFNKAAEQTKAILEASPLPEVHYFMEHFIPGFSLTLDELQTL